MEKQVKLYFEIQFAKHSEGNFYLFSQQIYFKKNLKNR